MEHVQVGRSPRNTFGRFRNRIAFTAICLLAPLAKAEKPIIKDLNAQLGKTANQIVLQPFFGVESLTGHKIPGAITPGACRQLAGPLGPGYAGWHACVIEIGQIPGFVPGIAPRVESWTSGTATGGPRVIPTVGGVGPDGRPYDGRAPWISGRYILAGHERFLLLP